MAHRRIGDTRGRPKHMTPPQTKKRTLISNWEQYETADFERDKLVLESFTTEFVGTYQIRKNKHGFGIYQRVAS